MAIGTKTGGRDWQPGESGNPNGRPPAEETMTGVLRSRVNKQEIADKLIALANEGNVAALKYVYDRLDGMPRQSVEVTGDKEKPVPLLILRSAHATSTETG
jgi:hypothetical protein